MAGRMSQKAELVSGGTHIMTMTVKITIGQQLHLRLCIRHQRMPLQPLM